MNKIWIGKTIAILGICAASTLICMYCTGWGILGFVAVFAVTESDDWD
jgi:hypothetical protein